MFAVLVWLVFAIAVVLYATLWLVAFVLVWAVQTTAKALHRTFYSRTSPET